MRPLRDAQLKLTSFMFGVFLAFERILPVDWVIRDIRLPSGKNESEPGRVSFETRPYLQEPLNEIINPEVQDIIWVAPTRMGKTFLLRMVFAYVVAVLKLPILWYDATVDTARAVSQKELWPMILHNKVLRDRLPKDRHLKTTTKILFPAAFFQMFGANSPAQAAGATACFVVGNEYDKWQAATEKEASTGDLVKHRTESYEDLRKHFLSSTPTIEDLGIDAEYKRGDQRKWHVECPKCESLQDLIWDQVKWDKEARRADGSWDLKRVKKTAHYECKHCQDHWDQKQLRKLVRVGKWIPTAEGAPGIRSYQINGLYGPLKVNEMGELAVSFLSSRRAGFYTDRQDWWNSRMGMVWVDDVSSLTVKKFAEREGDYLRGDLPDGFKPDLVIIGADVQTYGLPFVVEAYTWGGEHRTVDHGVAATFKDLEKIQLDYWALAPRRRLIIDMKFNERRVETLEYVRKNLKRGWIAAEGHEIMGERVKLEKANVYLGGKLQTREIMVPKLLVSTYDFKVDLEKIYAGVMRNWQTYQLPLLASDQEKEEQSDFYDQLLCERRVPRKRLLKGKPAFEFKARHNRNHFNDCKVYIRGLFFMLQKSRSARSKKRERRDAVKVKTS